MAKRIYRFPDGKELTIGGRTLVMGILNVTPDSFSDGGKWNTRDNALRHMEEMAQDGADIIDIGAESSRPGFVLAECPVPVSVDTFKAQTARAALTAGAHMLNDIWGLQYAEESGEMARAAAEANVPVIVMHNQDGTVYEGDVIASMRSFFERSFAIADAAGLSRKIPALALARRQSRICTFSGAWTNSSHMTTWTILCFSVRAARALSGRHSICLLRSAWRRQGRRASSASCAVRRLCVCMM